MGKVYRHVGGVTKADNFKEKSKKGAGGSTKNLDLNILLFLKTSHCHLKCKMFMRTTIAYEGINWYNLGHNKCNE